MKFELIQPLINDFKKIKGIESVYVYGSFLNDSFNHDKSDIDFLIIAKEKDQVQIIKRIRVLKKKFENRIKIDLNICFLSEFKLRVHINRPPTYFIGIKKKGKLLFGRDILKTIKDSEATPKVIYERVANLAQSARALYLNGEEKDADFWVKYQRKWLVVAFLEALFLEGTLNLNKKGGLSEFIKKTGAKKKFLNLLHPEKTSVLLIFEASEWLRDYLLKKHKTEIMH